MLKTALGLSLAAALPVLAAPAFADEVRTSTSVAAAALSTEKVAMVSYFVPAGNDLYDVTATWVARGGSTPQRLVLKLDDGDRVSFTLPGHEETTFTFAREIDAVIISSEPTDAGFRNASL
jgi:hypothetical protein